MRKRDETPDDELNDADLDDFVIPDDDEPDPENEPVQKNEITLTVVSVSLSIAVFMLTVWRSMRGMFGHTAISSLTTLIVIAVVTFPIFVLSAFALKATRPHEGTVIRGLALTSAVLSTLSLLLLANSIGTLIQILH